MKILKASTTIFTCFTTLMHKQFIFAQGSCRTHCCGFDAFYGISKLKLVPKIWPIQYLGLDFYIGNRGLIFGNFFTIFAFKIINIDVGSIKIISKMQTMNGITRKSWRWKFYKFWTKFGKFQLKMHCLTKMWFT